MTTDSLNPHRRRRGRRPGPFTTCSKLTSGMQPAAAAASERIRIVMITGMIRGSGDPSHTYRYMYRNVCSESWHRQASTARKLVLPVNARRRTRNGQASRSLHAPEVEEVFIRGCTTTAATSFLFLLRFFLPIFFLLSTVFLLFPI